MKRLHLLIHGRVQGINFRYYTRKKAVGLGLTGWVKNVNDDVEVVAEGSEEKLKELIEFCQKGPLLAKVRDVKVKWEEYKREFKEFEIRY